MESVAIMPWSVKTPAGESRSKHGISHVFNGTVTGRGRRKAQERRRLAHRQERAAWSNDNTKTNGQHPTLIGYKAD